MNQYDRIFLLVKEAKVAFAKPKSDERLGIEALAAGERPGSPKVGRRLKALRKAGVKSGQEGARPFIPGSSEKREILRK